VDRRIRRREGDCERCKSDRTAKKSRYFSSLFVVYLFTRLRGDRSVRKNFSPFLLLVHDFLPAGKRCPSTPNSTVRLVTLVRFLRASSSQTFWTTAVLLRAIVSSNLPIGIPLPMLMAAAAAAAAATGRNHQKKEREKEKKKKRTQRKETASR